MNDRANGDPGNPLVMPELARLLGPGIILQANTKWMLTSGVLFLLTASFAWLNDAPKDIHLYIVVYFSVPVGLVLGYRAKLLKLKLDGGQTLRTAIGVGWRTGALWIMVSAMGEYLVESTTSSTMADFPGMFGVSILGVSSSFLVAYGATAAVIRIRSRSNRSLGWLQILNLLIGIGGLTVGVVGLSKDAGSSLENKTGARMPTITMHTAQTDVDSDPCPPEVIAGTEVSCALRATDEVLSDGTYYHSFTYMGAKDENITISMSAEEFDTLLILGVGDITKDSFEFHGLNDDGGIGLGTNSRLSYTFEEGGIYTVIANTVEMGETGNFRLQIDSKN